MNTECLPSEKKGNKILLYSGGFDSFVQSFLLKPDLLLYFDINGYYSKAEVKYLKGMKHYAPLLIDTSLKIGDFEMSDYYLPFRNPLFILTAMLFGQHIVLGLNSHDNAVDKNINFLINMDNLIKGMIGHRNDSSNYFPKSWVGTDFSITAPFQSFSKSELLGVAIDKGIDIEAVKKIRTCYDNKSEKGCGKCPPCFQKADALIKNKISIKSLFDSNPSSSLKDKKIIEQYL